MVARHPEALPCGHRVGHWPVLGGAGYRRQQRVDHLGIGGQVFQLWQEPALTDPAQRGFVIEFITDVNFVDFIRGKRGHRLKPGPARILRRPVRYQHERTLDYEDQQQAGNAAVHSPNLAA